MTIREVDEKLVLSLDFEQFGFKHRAYDQNFNIAFFYKNDGLKTDMISYGYGGYTHRAIDTISICGSAFKKWVSFPIVENILLKFTPKENITNSTFDFINQNDKTIVNHPMIEQYTSEDKFITLYENNNLIDSNFQKVTLEIINYAKLNFLPFFQKVHDLQEVNDEIIDKIPQMQLSNYIPGQFMSFKKQIIMKLCSNPSYDDYLSWLNGKYQSAILTNPERYSDQYKMFQNLSEYLNSGLYKELL
ncbi:hypothetical protein GCM10027592_62870 [Spirosoma flavus]